MAVRDVDTRRSVGRGSQGVTSEARGTGDSRQPVIDSGGSSAAKETKPSGRQIPVSDVALQSSTLPSRYVADSARESLVSNLNKQGYIVGSALGDGIPDAVQIWTKSKHGSPKTRIAVTHLDGRH